jgi:hypothetical protein
MRPARVTRAGRFNPRTPRLSVSVVFVAGFSAGPEPAAPARP